MALHTGLQRVLGIPVKRLHGVHGMREFFRQDPVVALDLAVVPWGVRRDPLVPASFLTSTWTM